MVKDRSFPGLKKEVRKITGMPLSITGEKYLLIKESTKGKWIVIQLKRRN